MENNTNSTNIFEKYPALKALGGIALIAVLFVGVQALRDAGRLGGQRSQAGCYGYNCQPTLVVGGRAITGGYGGPFSYGTLSIRAGSPIELTWYATNVDYCRADWTQFTGTYMPPTYYGPVRRSQKFPVTCYTNGRAITGGLFVNAITVSSGDPTASDTLKDSATK